VDILKLGSSRIWDIGLPPVIKDECFLAAINFLLAYLYIIFYWAFLSSIYFKTWFLMDSNVLSTKGFVLKILTKSIIVMLVLTGMWWCWLGLVSAGAWWLWPCSDFKSLLIDCFPLINPKAIKGRVSSSKSSLPRSFSSQILNSYLANSISCYGCMNLSKLSSFPCAFIHP